MNTGLEQEVTMPLYRKLIVMTVLLFGVLLSMVYVLEFKHTSAYLTGQMTSEMNNTLNALIRSLIPHLQQADRQGVVDTIDATFERGYYREIAFQSSDGSQPIVRTKANGYGSVPGWFINLAEVVPVSQSQSISSGTQQFGTLSMTTSPAIIYQQLWSLSGQILMWILIAAGSVLLMMLYTIRRLLRPLVAIEAHANEVAERHFGHVLPEPDLVELKSLVQSHNHMAQRLQKAFARQAQEVDQLRRAAYQDRLTGLGNKLQMESELQHWMSEPGNGGLIFIRIYHMDRVANEQGYQRRDELVMEVAMQLREMRKVTHRLIPIRMSEAEFAVIAVGFDREQLEEKVVEIDQRLTKVTWPFAGGLGRLHAIGAVERFEGQDLGNLLASADSALQQARLGNAQAYRLLADASGRPALGRTKWRELVRQALKEGSLEYQVQPVMSLSGKTTSLELFSGIKYQGMLYPAAQFMPFVEQYGLGAEYDKHLLKQMAPSIATRGLPIVVNLSESAIGDVAFVNWLSQWLENDMMLRKLVGFELPEGALVDCTNALQTLVQIFRRLDVRFGFDRIGRHLGQLKALVELGPAYLKIDRSLVFCSEQEDNGFLKSLARMAHDQDIDLIVVRIESQAQLDALRDKSVDGYQGFIRPAVKWKLDDKPDEQSNESDVNWDKHLH